MRNATLYKKSRMEYQIKKDSKETQNGQMQKRQLPEGKFTKRSKHFRENDTALETDFSERSWVARR